MRNALAALAAVVALVSGGAAHADTYLLEYNGRAYGVLGIGTVRMEVRLSAEQYTASVGLRSGGLLALFERTTLNAASAGGVVDGLPRWRSYVLDHAYSAKRRQIRMTAADSGVEAVIEPTYRLWGDPATTAAQKAASRDPLASFVALGASVAASRRCEGTFATFDGRFHYLLRLSGGRADTLRSDAYRGPVLRCTLQYVPVAGFEAQDGGGSGRVPTGEMWFALTDDPGFAPPLRVTVPLPLGEVGLYLSTLRRGSVALDGEMDVSAP
ncbi:MAG: hypothetical protein ACOYKM_05090 [Caulobacterales bacterium]|jgi:hypothetical protein